LKTFNQRIVVALLAIIAVAGVAVALLARPATVQPLMFGRVLFGLDKTNPAAVYHFIVRGPEIFVDANKDDIPQAEERCNAQQLELIRDEKTNVTFLTHEIRLVVNPKFVSETLPQQLSMTCDIDAGSLYQQIGTITLSTDPKTPSWTHFHGPTKLVFTDPGMPLLKGSEGTEIRVWVGTSAEGQGIELGTPAAADEQTTQPDSQAIPDMPLRFAHIAPKLGKPVPTATIEFPTDGPPLIEQLSLDDFC
jgi:hypothetical protein